MALATFLSGGRPSEPAAGPAGSVETPEVGLTETAGSGPRPAGLPRPGWPRLSPTLGPIPPSPVLTGPGLAGPDSAEPAELPGEGEGTESGEETLAERAAAWAEQDPAAGLEWALRLPNPEEQQVALENLAWGCAGRNRTVAIEALEQLPPGEPRWRLAAHVASQWAVEHLDDAERWAGSRSNPFERDAALAAVAIGVAEVQPVRAATLVARDLPAGPARDHAVVAVVQRWVQSDPDGVERWVATFADRPLQAAARAAILATVPSVPPEARVP